MCRDAHSTLALRKVREVLQVSFSRLRSIPFLQSGFDRFRKRIEVPCPVMTNPVNEKGRRSIYARTHTAQEILVNPFRISRLAKVMGEAFNVQSQSLGSGN
jgi:hypothetical protein